MLTIVVSRKKQIIVTTDGMEMKVNKVFVRQGRKFKQLNDYTNFGEFGSTRVVIDRSFCRLKRVPKNLLPQKGIDEFLRTHHAKQHIEFDCYAFVNLVRRVEPHKVRYLNHFWKTQLQKDAPRVGDILFLVNRGGDFFHHAAVYLGFGMYVSVYGGGGDLEFSTLQHMQKEFKARRVLRATPKAVTNW